MQQPSYPLLLISFSRQPRATHKSLFIVETQLTCNALPCITWCFPAPVTSFFDLIFQTNKSAHRTAFLMQAALWYSPQTRRVDFHRLKKHIQNVIALWHFVCGVCRCNVAVQRPGQRARSCTALALITPPSVRHHLIHFYSPTLCFVPPFLTLCVFYNISQRTQYCHSTVNP